MDSWWVGVVICLGLGIATVVVRRTREKHMLAIFILGLCGILASTSYIIFVAVKWAKMKQAIDAAQTNLGIRIHLEKFLWRSGLPGKFSLFKVESAPIA